MQLLGDHVDILHIDEAQMVFGFEIISCDHYICKLAIIEHKSCEAVNENCMNKSSTLYETNIYIIYDVT